MARTPASPVGFLMTRTSGANPDPAKVLQLARPFAAGLDQIGTATLLAVRDEIGINNYLITAEHSRAQAVAQNLAQAVGAEARRIEELPVLDPEGAIGWVVARPSEYASRDTQSGGDPVEVARLLGRELTPGAWFAATVRRASKKEVGRARRWYDHRLGGAQTHHSKEGEPLVVSFTAGAPDEDTVRSLLASVIAALPGFDIEVETRTGSVAAQVAAFGVASPVLAVGTDLASHSIPAAIVVGLIPAAVAVGYATRRIPTRVDRLLDERDRLNFSPPPHRWRKPKPPRKEGTKTVKSRIEGVVVSEQRQIDASDGDYPLAATAFMVGSSVIVGVAAPYTGTASGISATATTHAPPALLGDIGPYVGDAGKQRVRISSADQIEGVVLMGLPGRGKSVAVQNLFAFDVLERVQPSTKPGRCGTNNTLIAFENKGAGAAGYQRWISLLGDASILVDLADPFSPAIDLFAIPGTAEQRADFAANMMQYVFGKQAIGDQSMNTLKAVFHAAFLLPPEIASAAVEGGFNAHPMSIAHGLLSGYGDEEGEKIAGAFVRWAKAIDEFDPARDEAIRAARKLTLLYGPKVTPSQRRSLTSAPISKTGLLVSADFWWSDERAKTTWRDVLENHWAVIINTGSSDSGAIVSEDLTEAFSAMLAYALKDSIQRNCSGWQDAGRYVSIFADELSLFAKSSPEVVTWIRNQGRSFGVRPTFATQYPAQLLPEVRDAVLSFSTCFWFTQNSPAMLEMAIADLNGGGGEYAVTDIANLEPYRAIMRTAVDKQRQPSVPVTVAYWGPTPVRPEGRETEFAMDQGYASASPMTDAHAEPSPVPLALDADPLAEGGYATVTDDIPTASADPFAAFEGRA